MLSADQLSRIPTALVGLAATAFAFGGLICVINFLIFLKWLCRDLVKTRTDSYRSVSAIPIVGSLIVALLLNILGSIWAVKVTGIVLIAIDSGGIHWSLLALPYLVYRAIQKYWNRGHGQGRPS